MDDQQEIKVKDESPRNTNTIFIVEDDPSIGSMLTDIILQETSYYPVLLIDGQQALKLTEYIKPYLFLIDYYLPKMNGIELYDRLHAKETLQDVPAIILDASLERNRKAYEERELIALSKPFELEELLSSIQGILAQVPERPPWYHPPK
jgi:DNA-binding response OmpR family regulator